MSTQALKAVATGKSDNPVASFSAFLEKFKPQMALALPKHLTADRMARLAVTAFSTTPKLQECEPKTIVGAIMTAATLGLEISVDGQGFLVPYGRTCTFVPGWKGLQDLVNRSGRGTTWTGAVFEGDEFEYALGDSPFVKHRPGVEDDPAKLKFVYAIGRVNGSDWPIIEVWPIEKVRKHRDKYNKVGAKHYSFRDWEMYARKVPLLQVIKYMPKSIELSNALAIANAADEGRHAVIDGDFVTVTDPADVDMTPPAGSRASESIDESTGEIKQKAPAFDHHAFVEKMKACKDVDVLDLLGDTIRDIPGEENQAVAREAYNRRRDELTGA